jgi:S-formylglutathione hydrolase FrmB
MLAALGTLAAGIGWRDAKWRTRRLPLIVGGATLVMLGVYLWVVVADPFNFTYPSSFYVWIGLPVLAALVAGVGWVGAPPWRRVVAIVAIPLTAAFAGNIINQHYAYYPSLNDFLNRPVKNQVSMQQLQELENRDHDHDHDQPVTQVRVGTSAESTPGTSDPSGAAASSTASTPGMTDVPSTLPTTDDHGGAEGVVVTVDIPATVAGFKHRPELVYLPPAWFAKPRPQLPVLMMIAGTPGQPANWIRAAGAQKEMDNYVRGHGGLGAIMVFPDNNGSFTGDTECVDGPQGNAQTYLSVDVRNYVISTFGASPDPQRWAVVGLSEGGTCATLLSVKHPDLFRSFADLSGDLTPNVGSRDATLQQLYGGNAAAMAANDPLTIIQHTKLPEVSGWFEDALSDHSKMSAAEQLSSALRAAGGDVQLVEKAGGHNFTFWTQCFIDSAGWVLQKVGLPA